MTATIGAGSAPITAGSSELRELIAQIDAGVLEREETQSPPHEQVEQLKLARFGALRLDPAEGGGGASLPELFSAIIGLAEADPNIAHSLRNHFQFVEGLKRRPSTDGGVWAAQVRAGKIFGLAYTELSSQQAGKRQTEFATRVTRSAAGLVLNGEKYYSTGNLYADLIVVAASDEDGEPVRLVVPADRPGVEIPDDWDGIGQRFTGSGTTRFVDTPVYEADRLGPVWGDVPYPSTFPQLYLTAVIAGILARIARDAGELVRVKTRTFYHSPTADPVQDPVLQLTVGNIASQAFVAEAAVLSAAAALAEATEARGSERESDLALQAALRAAKAKVVVDELALKAAGDLFDVSGGSAVRRRNHYDRHWRNIRTIAAHNPRTYKARAVGAYQIDRTPLPNGAYF